MTVFALQALPHMHCADNHCWK